MIPYVMHGWPDDKSQLPSDLSQFWTFRSELTIADGVLYKGAKILIPTTMRPTLLEKIHAAHQGVEKSIHNASDTLFWPGMRTDIKTVCEDCDICAEYAAQHQKEPMLSYSIPELPWQFVSQYILKFRGDHYLITVDHYSDYFEMDKLHDTLASIVVEVTKTIFARHGSPMQCLTDNGPQFISEEYESFAEVWNFRHITSAPYFSQSNGRAEAAVKATKKLLKKCKDPLLGLLHLRNTPTKGHRSSPVQRLMSRRTHTSLPVCANLLEPEIVPSDVVVSEKKEQRLASKSYYDQTAGTELPKLLVGDHVYIKPRPTEKNANWKYGKIIATPAPRSYTVQMPSGVARRNARHVRVAAPPSHSRLMESRPEPFVESTSTYVPSTTVIPHLRVTDSNLPCPGTPRAKQRTRPRHIGDSTPVRSRLPSPSHLSSSRSEESVQLPSAGSDDSQPTLSQGYTTRSGRLSKPRTVLDM